jgi:hypothetical protein
VASGPGGRAARPLLGLRRKPGRLALGVFRLPLLLYRRGKGGLLGHTFVLLAHAGRKTGKPYWAVAMVLRYDPHTHEAVICSAWGQDSEPFSSFDLAGLEDVDGFGELPGPPGAAVEFAQDAPGLELGISAFGGGTQLGVGAVGRLL